jgi:RNA polymerase primary sigma factor
VLRANQGVPGLELDVLIQEGNIGLLKGIEHFDYRRGSAVTTYTTWWIKQFQLRLLPQTRSIPLPVHIAEALGDLRKMERQLQQELGCAPTEEELALALNITPQTLAQLRLHAAPVASLDASETDVSDEGEHDPLEVAPHELRRLLRQLQPRLAQILRLRFGLLDHGRQRTLLEVGREFGLTRERIRQLEAIALEKLRTLLKRDPEESTAA